jgi:hypothetical protein
MGRIDARRATRWWLGLEVDAHHDPVEGALLQLL